MQLVRRLLVVVVLVPVMAMAVVIGDVVLNERRVFYAMLGRDGLVAACRTPLVVRLQALGFEPSDIAFGETPDIALWSGTGRSLRDTITFADGPAQTRVDAIVACSVRAGDVTVEVKTATTPTRAT